MRSYLSVSVMIAGVLSAGTGVASAQQPPPIGGLTGTIALEGTVQKFYDGVNTILVKTVDGIEHLFHLTGRTEVHGRTATGERGLFGLEEGSRVVVHYTADADHETAEEVDCIDAGGMTIVDGVVTELDRRAKTISIRLADGTEQTLRLTERAASDDGRDVDGADAGTANVVVYVVNDDGASGRVAHYFRRVS